MTVGTLVCGVCAVVLMLIGLWGKTPSKMKIAELLILVIISYGEFPFLYYVYGKSTIVYMILGIVGTATFMDGYVRQGMLVSQIIFDVGIIITSYIHPLTMESITEENSIGSTICSFVIVAISVSGILTLLVKQYVWQQKELVNMSKKMERMAYLDPLTSLYNRRYLTDYLTEKLQDSNADLAEKNLCWYLRNLIMK